MFGAKTSLVLLFLVVFSTDLKAETQDSCDFGVPVMNDFDIRRASLHTLLSPNIKDITYDNVLTNSRKFANSFCMWQERLGPSQVRITVHHKSLPPNKSTMVPVSSVSKRKGRLNMRYFGTSTSQEVNDLIIGLSGSYSFLGTDYKNYIVIGACLDKYEKPLIRVLAPSIRKSDKQLRDILKGLGLDDTQFTSLAFNKTGCYERFFASLSDIEQL